MLVDYEIIPKGNKFIAQKINKPSTSFLPRPYAPNQILIWKEKEEWTSNHVISKLTLAQFSFAIENNTVFNSLKAYKYN